MRKKSILFLRPNFKALNNAPSVNAPRRIKSLKKIGYRVIDYRYRGSGYLNEFRNLLRISKITDVLYIRIDGSGLLDKFTLLKLFNLKLYVIWEVHGINEEELEYFNSTRTKIKVIKNNVKRFLLSYLVDVHIFISRELRNCCKKKFRCKKSIVIPNFVDENEINKYKNLDNRDFPSISYLNNKKFFKIFWGGDPTFKWQAIDVIEKVARQIYRTDKNIIFIIAGSTAWHNITWEKNLLKIESVSRDAYLRLAKQADICLALYNKPNNFPFYFSPLKILDYMSLGKATIVSKFPTTEALIKNGKDGVLVNNSPTEVTEAILGLRRNRSLIKKIGGNAAATMLNEHSLKLSLLKYRKAMSMLGNDF